jgi:ABC-type phosphonate transport system ATPase subunit
MITVEGVTREYGTFTAVDDVSFTAREGRVTGFLGRQRGRQVNHDAGHGRSHPCHVGHRHHLRNHYADSA